MGKVLSRDQTEIEESQSMPKSTMDNSASLATAKSERFRTLLSKLVKHSPTKGTIPTNNQPEDAASHTILLSKLLRHSSTKDTLPTNNESNNATPNSITISTTTTSPSALQTLPIELLLNITSHLPAVDAACLSLTNHHFKHTLPIPNLPPPSRRCYTWLLATRLETDLLSSLPPSTPDSGLPSQLMCCYCKHRHPLHDFIGNPHSSLPRLFLSRFKPSSSPLPPFTAPDRLYMPPEQRACGFHEPEVTWVPEPGCACMAQGRKRYWLLWMDLTCLHCGTVVEGGGVSDEEGAGAGAGVRDDGRETGCLKCLCEICPRRPMETFERYGPLVGGWGGNYPEIKGFIRTSSGKLKIVEKGAWKPFNVRDAHPHGGLPAGDGGHGEGDDRDEEGEEG
ncbi:hypothetical protein G7Y79_00012g032210 [Physcia stellaris]|nr:hypothetical protein G7Y79_00012g032210 [Physcia stellaris]